MNKKLQNLVSALLVSILLVSITSKVMAQSEEKAKMAVYAVGVEDELIKTMAQNKVITALTQSQRYQLIERSKDFVNAIKAEYNTQNSGDVADDQIANIGNSYGAKYVCVVSITHFKESHFMYVAVRMVDVEKKASQNSGEGEGNYNGPADLTPIITTVINQMLGSPSAIGSFSTNKPQQSGMHKNGEVYNPDGIEMVYVEGTGTGILDTKGFYIGKYEVTQAQWKAVMGKNPSVFTKNKNPVECVSWNDCQEFIKKLNSKTGRKYCLPTEAQWEYAARGGKAKETYEYAGSNTIGLVAWYADNSGSCTHQVGTKSPNNLGIYDMSGNVWEWCENCYDTSCSSRVLRGGGWLYEEKYSRVSCRSAIAPDRRISYIGFRLVLVQ